MSAGDNHPRGENEVIGGEEPARPERRSGPRFSVRRSIWFRRRGAIPARGLLLNISERGALARVDKPESPYAVAWPLYLRHGDELWLWDVLEDPLACWVVAVERDLVRLRIINDAGILPELRAFLSHVARHNVSTAGVLHPEVVLPTDEHPSISS